MQTEYLILYGKLALLAGLICIGYYFFFAEANVRNACELADRADEIIENDPLLDTIPNYSSPPNYARVGCNIRNGALIVTALLIILGTIMLVSGLKRKGSL